MKKLNLLVLLTAILYALSVNAAGSFRLASGKLISTGKSKSEVIAIAGAPMYQEVETIAVDEGVGNDPVKREVLTYKLRGDIGGMFLVVVTVENNTVVSVAATQESRL
ncbi:DUF2845 domain-containing protein [Microbulbifer celer]|uniref:DUF2845 domain-containing protein n=1 Tax=Microbulbifer celer TaxID=435905 RepID=A0ABW3U8N4_9GAMM|nr:DUF2845 domain-containing protein [Microbulbifer celer]UFN56830.1 DUF2845 domain-containing protein [Microbulbifer celer]